MRKREHSRDKKSVGYIDCVSKRCIYRIYIYRSKGPDAIDKALVGMVNVFVRDKLLVQ